MAAGRQDRQPGCYRAADMKQREAVDHCVGFIEAVNLSEAPGGVNLIAVRQADELRTARRAPGMEQRTHGVTIGGELKLQGIALRGKCRNQS